MGGFGLIADGPAPINTDGDGLPDDWKTAHGLNPKQADSDRVAASGYTQFEEYLNWLALTHPTRAAGKSSEVSTPTP